MIEPFTYKFPDKSETPNCDIVYNICKEMHETVPFDIRYIDNIGKFNLPETDEREFCACVNQDNKGLPLEIVNPLFPNNIMIKKRGNDSNCIPDDLHDVIVTDINDTINYSEIIINDKIGQVPDDAVCKKSNESVISRVLKLEELYHKKVNNE